jgi:hypothetical protein
LSIRGDLWIALLGPSVEKGIVGIGPSVKAIDRQIENAPANKRFLRPPQRLFFFLVGLPFRLVFAILRSSALLIDLYMPLEAPLRDDFLRLPLLAANAAPAAICCFFDFAGIQISSSCL